MSLLAGLRYRLRALFRQREFERELKEEIDFHLSLDAMQERAPDSVDDADPRRAAGLEMSRTMARRHGR